MTVIAHATDLSGDDQLAFVHACALTAASGARLVTVHGNHGRASDARMPVAAPWAGRWGNAGLCRGGDRERDSRPRSAARRHADGHDGAIDSLFGSHPEHVVRQAVCPVLSVPLRPRA